MPANLVKPQHFLDLQARVVYQGDLKELLGTAGQGGDFALGGGLKKLANADVK